MENLEDVHQEFDVKISMGQFKDFLIAQGRYPGCPVCPNQGTWNFYVDKSKGAGEHAMMALTPVVSKYHGLPDDTFYVLVMDCTNCGHMSYTSSQAVLKWLKSKASGK